MNNDFEANIPQQKSFSEMVNEVNSTATDGWTSAVKSSEEITQQRYDANSNWSEGIKSSEEIAQQKHRAENDWTSAIKSSEEISQQAETIGRESLKDLSNNQQTNSIEEDNSLNNEIEKSDEVGPIKGASGYEQAIENNPDDIIGGTQPTPGYGTDKYIIQKGDTLSEIAHENNKNGGQFMSVEALALLNGIENPNLINTGDELTLTVDPSVVESSIDKINTMISNVQNLQNQIPKLAEFGTTDNGQLDETAKGIINDINTSTATIISNAELYQKWLNDLLTALSDTELYATNVIDGNNMFNVSNIE